MKTTRTFASICLSASCIALFAATNVSVGDQPGVFRMASAPQDNTPPPVQNGLQPVPDGNLPGQFVQDNAGQFNLNGAPNGQGVPVQGNQPQFVDPNQFLQRSAGVTSPIMGPQAFAQQPLVGPQATFEQNIDSGLGFQDSYTRINARIPNWLVPNTAVISMDLSASLSAGGDDLYNYGVVYRHFDEQRNRVWGINAFGDFDNTTSLSDYSRFGIGLESLGRYLDFIFNAYIVTGEDTFLSSRTVLPDLSLRGNNVVRSYRETRENAYSGFDAKIGGPLPWLGRRGINGYVGTYMLASEYGSADALGVSAEVQVLATESFEVNAYYTNDEVFGTNSWVSLAYTIPNTRERQILRPRRVRDRMTDPVRRTNTIHSKTETLDATEAVINAKTLAPWTILHVDPNALAMGTGTVESPYMTLQAAADANLPGAGIDAIRVIPRTDDTGVNLAVTGGLDLLPEQALFAANKSFALFTEGGVAFSPELSGTVGGPGPLVQDPTMVAGGAVIRASDWNRISGLRIDAANSTSTVFGMGVDGPGVEGIHLACNTFTNYTIGANITAAEDELLFDENTFTGLAGTSTHGLMVTTKTGSTSDLRVRDNTATNNSTAGLYVRAAADSTINADNPLGTGFVEATGVDGNTTTNNGDGIVLNADAGATFNAVVRNNVSTNNTRNGFVATADGAGALFNLSNLSGNTFSLNTENGAFLHYLNGGSFLAVTEDLDGNGVLNPYEDINGNGILDPTEDVNGNGVLDPGEDTDGDGVLDLVEDINGDGLITAAEDINGNGILDQGIVSNTMSDNVIAGLCIFGEDVPDINNVTLGGGDGTFDIGGPQIALGNTFTGNLGAGIAVDLQDGVTYQADTINNVISAMQTPAGSTPTTAALTFVLDFVEASQGTLADATGGGTLTPFDVTDFGFAATDFDLVTGAILEQVRDHFRMIPTTGQDSRSQLADGQQLAIDFVVGDVGTAPSNGATEFYYALIGSGDAAAPFNGSLGLAPVSGVRDAAGNGPNGTIAIGDQVNTTYPDNFLGLPGLDMGNLTFTRNALANTISHELGHSLSLDHVFVAGSETPAGTTPMMQTGEAPFDGPNSEIIAPNAFSFSALDENGVVVNNVQQLIGAVGTRSALQTGASGGGITVVAGNTATMNNMNATRAANIARIGGTARTEPTRFLNNTIENLGGTGLSIQVNDSARAEDITIQSNTIRNNMGRGINLEANGPLAFIDASQTIGGTGTNTLDGTTFAQGNLITGNQGDGIRALASAGGTIYGNLLNNEITQNSGNGVSLLIDRGGIVDFGTPASNRIISGNLINGNVGIGIHAESTVISTVSEAMQEMNLLVQGNTVTQNMSGGLIATLNGVNNIPPGPPALGFRENNVLNLTIGQTTAPFSTSVPAESNLFDENEGVGIGVVVNGTGLANVNIVGNTVTNTSAGTDALFNGDGINLIRRDSSLLLASVLHNTLVDNASNGLEVDTQGTNKDNQNQPMVGTANSVTWNNNILNGNGENGASFATRGDSQLFANGMANVLTGNTLSGIQVSTSENSSFGDPTLVGDARRSLFSGIITNNNGLDGIGLTSTGDSQLLLEITSARVATTSGAHAALNTMGNTVISDNGRDGIHIDSSGTSRPDILIGAEKPVTATSAITAISGNGTNNTTTIAAGIEIATATPFVLANDLLVNLGGNGIAWDSHESAGGMVQVYNTSIFNNLAGSSDDLNGDGILTYQEDQFGNWAQNYLLLGPDTSSSDDDLSVFTEGNLDIDVLGGDGIQFNYHQSANSTLIVGSEDLNGNGILDGGEDLNGNGILDHSMGNWIQNNEDDGIALTGDVRRITAEETALGDPFRQAPGPMGVNTSPTIVIADNDIGGETDGVSAGNGGDGVSVRSFGFTAAGVIPADVDNDLDDGDGFDPSGPTNPAFFVGGGASDLVGNNTSGPIPNIILAGNRITRNDRIGVNIRLQGGAGRFDLRTTPVAVDPVAVNTADYTRITLLGNTIASNGEEGVFLRADSDMNQNRIIYSQNLDDGTMTFNVNTFSAAGLDAQSGFPPNDVDVSLPGLNLATVQNTLFTAVGNIIQSNGTNTVNGEGIEIRVGTGAYVAADIRDNIFGGNLEADLFTGSFYSAMDFTNVDDGFRENAFTSVDVDGEFLYDIVYLRDAALLDMRFTGNTGDQINPLEDGAFDTNPLPFVGATPAQTPAVDIASIFFNSADPDPIQGVRTTGVFKIDGSPFLNFPTNNFVELGVPQSITGAFSAFQLQNASVESPWQEDPFFDID